MRHDISPYHMVHMMIHIIWAISFYQSYDMTHIEGKRENLKVFIKFYKGLILRCQTHQISDQMVDYQDFLGRVHFRLSIQGGYIINQFILHNKFEFID